MDSDDQTNSQQPPKDNPHSISQATNALTPFLSKHVPIQLSSEARNTCFRHRTDLAKRRNPDDITLDVLQKNIEKLPTADKEAISHIWSLFSACPAPQRILILQGLLTQCCIPQLSFLSNAIEPLLRIDFIALLPSELSLKVLSYLDAQSLCHAAQVCKTWKILADDDFVWQKLCAQHIGTKCSKCGWGLPVLNKVRRVTSPTATSASSASIAGVKRSIDELTLNSSSTGNVCGINDLSVRSPSPELSSTSTCPQDDDNQRLGYEAMMDYSEGEFSSDDDKHTQPHKRKRSDPLDATPRESDIKRADYSRRRPWKHVYSERLIVERNWRQNKFTHRVLSGHADGVMCLQFDDCQNLLITGSYDTTIRVWNLETGETIRILNGHTRCVRALQFDDAKLITGAMDQTIKIWNYHTGQLIRTLEGHTDGIVCLHFDERILASGSADATIKVWNFGSGEGFTLKGHKDWVNSVRIWEKNKLISCSDDTTIRIWDLNNRSCINVLKSHVGQVQVGIPSMPRFLHRFSEEFTGDIVANAPTSTDINCPDKKSYESQTPILVTGSLDNTIKIWSLTTGKCLRTLFGHVEGIWSLAFDKLRIVSGGHDSMVKVWDMDSGLCTLTLTGHSGAVTAVALGDSKVITGGDDGDIRIWSYLPKT